MNIEFLPLFFSFFFFSINERERKRKNFHSRDETSVSTFVDRFRWEVSMTRLSFSSPGFTGWQDGKGRKKVIYFIWETRTFTFTSFFFPIIFQQTLILSYLKFFIEISLGSIDNFQDGSTVSRCLNKTQSCVIDFIRLIIIWKFVIFLI